MQKTNIEWTDYVFNPIKGLCPVDCKLPDGKSYCYARKIYKRFTPQWRGWSGSGEPFVLADEFVQLDKLKKPSKIFVCSTFELFHPSVKKHIHWVFNAIEKNPQHTFQILTKFPRNIDRPMPDNVWLGTTVTNQGELYRITQMEKIKAKRRFVSFEPLLDFINWDGFRLEFSPLDWMIVGQLTGHGKKHEPKKYWINQIKFYAGYYGIPLFMKNNLKEIWGEPLIQEFPNKEGK